MFPQKTLKNFVQEYRKLILRRSQAQIPTVTNRW